MNDVILALVIRIRNVKLDFWRTLGGDILKISFITNLYLYFEINTIGIGTLLLTPGYDYGIKFHEIYCSDYLYTVIILYLIKFEFKIA